MGNLITNRDTIPKEKCKNYRISLETKKLTNLSNNDQNHMQCNYLSRLILPTKTVFEITLTWVKNFMDVPMVTSEMT